MNYKIMIVEDDPDIAELVSRHLEKFGFTIEKCIEFHNVLKEFEKAKPHLVLLDINLPAYDGFYWCGKIREKSSCPIIFLSSRNADSDQVYAMMNGGDDYVTKPFTPMELMARVNSQLRRYHRFLDRLNSGQKENPKIHQVGGLEVNEETVEVNADGKNVKVTPIEFKILLLLIRNPGRVFPAEEIYERVWNERAINTDTVMVHIRNLREKIEVDPKDPKYIKVVWGVGYKLEKQ